MQEELNRKADQLYQGKVLIDRVRTRDMLAQKFRTTRPPAGKPERDQIQYQSSDASQRKSSGIAGQEMPFAITSRQKDTNFDSEH